MRIALAAAVVALSAGLMLLACGGAVAPTEAPEAEPASATGEPPGDAGRDAGCAAATVEAWCAMVARGGVGVDPRADACCSRWIDDALRDE